ncbi:MAG TPA: UPF0149 family protein [Rudaea sp.]
MPSTPSITHAELGELLAVHQCGVGASDLHGSLTGYLCAGGSADPRQWLDALALECEQGAIASNKLEQLYRECADWLADPELEFEPLLPEPDASLGSRADALVEWCGGFLGGLGLAGYESGRGLSGDAAEILHDLGTIAASRFDHGENEEDENALTEVVEFIRVAVLLLHAELTALQRKNATVH